MHNILKITWLHLFPGLLITLLYVLLAPVVNAAGYPSLMAGMIAFLLVILPFEWFYLLAKGKQVSGRYSLSAVLPTQPVPLKKRILAISGGILAIVFIAGGMQFFDTSIKEALEQWLPKWYFFDEDYKSGYTKEAIIVTAGLRIVVYGFIIPIVEEQYFRGYLLPKIPATGVKAPMAGSILFALYHFWQPWNYPSLLLISGVLVFTAWHFKNYKISLYIHLIINLLGSIAFFLLVSKP